MFIKSSKVALIVFLVVVGISIGSGVPANSTPDEVTIGSNFSIDYKIDRIRCGKCQYVVAYSNDMSSKAICIVHAGDCDNPIHFVKPVAEKE